MYLMDKIYKISTSISHFNGQAIAPNSMGNSF
eukprot:UN02907